MTDDRAVGALLGLAVGDALGAAVEFMAPETFPAVTGMRGGGPHGLAAGEWTDDTAMALALADSIRSVGWDLNDQARRYIRWWRDGLYSVTGECFDIGMTTASALRRFESTGDARQSGEPGEQAAGNGSIMRLAPVAIAAAHRYPDDIAGLVARCVESSLPTHRAPQAVSACAVFGVILAGLVRGEAKKRVLDPDWEAWNSLPEALHPSIEEVVSGSYLRREPPQIVGSGYVVRSLEAALWAFARHDSYSAAVLAAVNLGDDADTTGAVCGQLAGATWGKDGIPDEWLSGLAWRDQIQELGNDLIAARI
jgi:ADP-ribosyl-[dinitrogen reductase] hydrolase